MGHMCAIVCTAGARGLLVQVVGGGHGGQQKEHGKEFPSDNYTELTSVRLDLGWLVDHFRGLSGLVHALIKEQFNR